MFSFGDRQTMQVGQLAECSSCTALSLGGGADIVFTNGYLLQELSRHQRVYTPCALEAPMASAIAKKL